MPRPTKRFGGLLVGAVALFIVGTNVQSGWLLVISSILAGAAVAGVVLPVGALRNIEVRRHAPAEAFQGAPMGVDVDVGNRGRASRLGVVVEDDHGSRVRVLSPTLGRGERVRLGTTRRALRRGIIETPSVRISSGAPFGVAVARRTLEAPSRTIVYPAVVSLGDLPTWWGLPSVDRASSSQPRRGAGPEYLGIREYRTGDSMRHVHWPSTARTGVVMVRELEREQTRSVTVVVDTLADVALAPDLHRTPLDVCCSVAASISLAGLRADRRVRLVAARGGTIDVLESTDPAAVLPWLSSLGPGGGLPVGAVLARTAEQVGDPGAVCVACPTWQSNDTDDLLAGLASLGVEEASVALVDVRGFGGRATARALGTDDAERAVGDLLEAGVRTVLIRAGDDLAERLRNGVGWMG